MVAEEAPPVLPWAVVLEHVEEAVPAQLVHQGVLVLKFELLLKTLIFFLGEIDEFQYLCRRERPGDEGDEGDVLRPEDLPAVLEGGDGGLPGAQGGGGAGLYFKGKQNGGYNGPVV